jgi:Undecaprenyl-phosphate glucose phosphotransferase
VSIESNIRDKIDELENSSSLSQRTFPSEAIPYICPAVDTLIILLSCFVGGFGYQLSAGFPLPDLAPQFAVGLLASLFYSLRMSKSGFYDFPEIATPRVEISEVLVYWFTTGLLLAFIAFLLKVGDAFSRGSFVIFYFLAPIGLLGMRKVTKTALARAISSGMIGRRDTVLVGEFNEMAALKPQDLLAVCGATEINRFVLSREVDYAARIAADSRIMDLVADFVRRQSCRQILLALSWSDSDRIDLIRDRIKVLPVAARLLPDLRVRSLTNLTWSTRNRALTIEIQTSPLSTAQRFAKRVVDIIASSLALIFFLPVMAFTAVAIKLDSPGPVIFRQARKGFNGKEFVIFKFRTMTVQENGPAVVQATRDDSRVTPIGGLLRSLSIDELPQLVNVLRGDMSLVGPRPHALAHDNYFETVLSDYAFRHHVKPGITGWAQCNGARGATPSIEHISERVKLDLWYINNWSLWLDFQILIKTFFEVVRKHNAY